MESGAAAHVNALLRWPTSIEQKEIEMAVDPKFIVNLKGKQFIMLGGLRELAEEKGIVDIRTEPVFELCLPAERFFVFCATGRFHDAEGNESQWVAYGDASPANSQMKGAELRHAETRAVARMLRFATNVAMTAIEEIGPEPHDAPPRNQERRTAPPRARHDPEDHAAAELGKTACQLKGCGVLLTADEIKGCQKNFGAERWCSVHGKARMKELKEENEAAEGVRLESA